MKKLLDLFSNSWAVDLYKVMTASWRSVALTIIVAAIGTYGYVKGSGNKDDCAECEAQKTKLVDFIIDINKQLDQVYVQPSVVESAMYSAFIVRDTVRPRSSRDSLMIRVKQRLDSAAKANKKSLI